MIMAPIVGFGVDAAIEADSVNPWWPVGALGLLCSILFFAKSVMEND